MDRTESLATASPDRLADLTRRYARYWSSAGGLASALGGLLALVAYLVGALVPPEGPWGRGALALTPFVWIAAKELARRRYYQPLGRVREARSSSDRRWHVGLTAFTAVVSVAVLGFVLGSTVTGEAPAPLDAGTTGYLVLVAAMPVLVWFFMPTPLEFIVGVFLVSQAAMMLAGASYELWEQPQAPIAGAVLLALGVKQHVAFRRLRAELVERGGRG